MKRRLIARVDERTARDRIAIEGTRAPDARTWFRHLQAERIKFAEVENQKRASELQATAEVASQDLGGGS